MDPLINKKERRRVKRGTYVTSLPVLTPTKEDAGGGVKFKMQER